MFQDKMISLADSYELSNLLIGLTHQQNSVTLWQNLDSACRICKDSSLVKVNIKKEEMEFFPKKGEFNFDSRLPIYFLIQTFNLFLNFQKKCCFVTLGNKSV